MSYAEGGLHALVARGRAEQDVDVIKFQAGDQLLREVALTIPNAAGAGDGVADEALYIEVLDVGKGVTDVNAEPAGRQANPRGVIGCLRRHERDSSGVFPVLKGRLSIY